MLVLEAHAEANTECDGKDNDNSDQRQKPSKTAAARRCLGRVLLSFLV